MARSRVEVLVRSEVARWPAFTVPFGSTAAEVEAIQAQRDDYVTRLSQACSNLPGDESAILRAVGRALSDLGGGPTSSGVPQTGAIHRRARDLLAAATTTGTERPLCARCRREDGITLFGRALPPQTSDIGPRDLHSDSEGRGDPKRHRPHMKEDLCGYHAELDAWERAGKAMGLPPPPWTRPTPTPGPNATEHRRRMTSYLDTPGRSGNLDKSAAQIGADRRALNAALREPGGDG